MKLIEAYKFMNKIIENGKDKGYSVSNIQKGLYDYLRILMEQDCLSENNHIILTAITDRLDEVIDDKKALSDLLIELYSELEDLSLEEEERKQLRKGRRKTNDIPKRTGNSCHDSISEPEVTHKGPSWCGETSEEEIDSGPNCTSGYTNASSDRCNTSSRPSDWCQGAYEEESGPRCESGHTIASSDRCNTSSRPTNWCHSTRSSSDDRCNSGYSKGGSRC